MVGNFSQKIPGWSEATERQSDRFGERALLDALRWLNFAFDADMPNTDTGLPQDSRPDLTCMGVLPPCTSPPVRRWPVGLPSQQLAAPVSRTCSTPPR